MALNFSSNTLPPVCPETLFVGCSFSFCILSSFFFVSVLTVFLTLGVVLMGVSSFHSSCLYMALSNGAGKGISASAYPRVHSTVNNIKGKEQLYMGLNKDGNTKI